MINRTFQMSIFLKVYVSFKKWIEINRWDFEFIEECHSTLDRQYLIGIIQADKLKAIDWFSHPEISTIILPDGIIENKDLVSKSLRKLKIQLNAVC